MLLLAIEVGLCYHVRHTPATLCTAKVVPRLVLRGGAEEDSSSAFEVERHFVRDEVEQPSATGPRRIFRPVEIEDSLEPKEEEEPIALPDDSFDSNKKKPVQKKGKKAAATSPKKEKPSSPAASSKQPPAQQHKDLADDDGDIDLTEQDRKKLQRSSMKGAKGREYQADSSGGDYDETDQSVSVSMPDEKMARIQPDLLPKKSLRRGGGNHPDDEEPNYISGEEDGEKFSLSIDSNFSDILGGRGVDENELNTGDSMQDESKAEGEKTPVRGSVRVGGSSSKRPGLLDDSEVSDDASFEPASNKRPREDSASRFAMLGAPNGKHTPAKPTRPPRSYSDDDDEDYFGNENDDQEGEESGVDQSFFTNVSYGIGIIVTQKAEGVVIDGLAEGGPAEKHGGIMEGDILCEVDGHSLVNSSITMEEVSCLCIMCM